MLTGLPNLLTLSRIAVIPLFVAAFYLPGAAARWVAFALFVVASATDYLDGWLARRRGQTTSFGRFLDPIADKLLVASALLMLVWDGHAPVLPALVILCREVLVSGLREFLAERRVSLPVTTLAKWKTATQMTALCLLLVGEAAATVGVPSAVTLEGGSALLWLAAVLTAITGYDYLRTALAHMRAPETSPRGTPERP